jgi:DNA-binding NtrC family response regulator
MSDPDILAGKSILAVDDEPDVLEVVKELLHTSHVDTAHNYEAARSLISNRTYDLIMLDIMGVNGFALLELAKERRIPCAMLTAHAITVDSVNRSLRLGAVSFLPKDELGKLPELVAEILEDLAQGKSHWRRLFDRLGPFFKSRLGISWEDLERPTVPPYSY